MRKLTAVAFAALAALGILAAASLLSAANATLIAESDGVVLDTITGLEWQQNANNCCFTWNQALAYASDLRLDGRHWRLPHVNELGTLYSDIHALGGCNGADCQGNQGPFSGIQTVYWSDAELVICPPNGPCFSTDAFFTFNFSTGTMGGPLPNARQLSVWAVRPDDGDFAIPEPGTLALIGMVIAGFGLSRRRYLRGMRLN
jgi:hypothetical protein